MTVTRDLALVNQSILDRLEGDSQECGRIFEEAFEAGDMERAHRYYTAAANVEAAIAVLRGNEL